MHSVTVNDMMNRHQFARTCAKLVCISAATWIATGCGSPQFHAIGYGWPLQCNTMRDMYDARAAAGTAALAGSDVAQDAHTTLEVSEAALTTGVTELMRLAEREIERAFAAVEIPGATESSEVDLHFSVRTLHIVERGGSPAIDVRMGGRGHATVAWPAGVVTESDFRVGAVFRFAVALEFEHGVAHIVFVPEGSDIDHFEFTTEGEGFTHDVISWIQTALVNAFDGPVLAAVGRRELVALAPIQLGETGILVEPVALVADPDANTLRMMWGTSLDVSVITVHSPPLGDSDVSIFVPADVLGPLVRQVTNASGGRRVDGDGRPDPNGKIWTFFEDMTIDDGQLVMTYSAYNRALPCSFTVLDVHIEPVVRDGRIHLELRDRRLLEGSRQQWLIRKIAPPLDQMETVMNEALTSGLGDIEDSELPSGTTLRVRFDAVEVTPAGVLVRASL
jgi:hypothetical protein